MEKTRATLAQQLAELLPPAPARVLLRDWGDGLEISGESGYQPATDGEPTDIVVWNATGATDPAEVLRGLRARLADQGTLLVAIALPASTGRRKSRKQGSLPTRDQEQLRRVILALSEGRFAVTRDREIVTSDAGAWHLLRARHDEYILRSYRAGDEQTILELFPSCFHAERGLDHWRWKYVDNPWGHHHISLATSADGRLATHYAGYPVPFWYGDGKEEGRVFSTLQMGDTMTNPAFRDVGRGRSGLLARTVRHFFAIHRGGSHGFFYGFNTGSIQRFCQWFIGGTQVQPVGYWTLDLATVGPESLDHRGYLVDRVSQVDGSWSRLFQRVAPEMGLLVARDARWLEWRYLQCPDIRYTLVGAWHWGRLVGWGVFRRRDDTLVWGDALFLPRHRQAASAVLRKALEQPENAGVTRIEAWFSSHPGWWLEEIAELGFDNSPEPNGLSLMALPEAEPEAAVRLARMYYTMGDGDLF